MTMDESDSCHTPTASAVLHVIACFFVYVLGRLCLPSAATSTSRTYLETHWTRSLQLPQSQQASHAHLKQQQQQQQTQRNQQRKQRIIIIANLFTLIAIGQLYIGGICNETLKDEINNANSATNGGSRTHESDGSNGMGGTNGKRLIFTQPQTLQTQSAKNNPFSKLFSRFKPQKSYDSFNPRISFQIHPSNNFPDLERFGQTYVCSAKPRPDFNPQLSNPRPDLPPPLSHTPPGNAMLNFTITVSTNLKLIFMGDSVGEQFAQGFDSASIVQRHKELDEADEKYDNANGADSTTSGSRSSAEIDKVRWTHSYLNRIWFNECLVISAPVRGGGVTGFWRMRELMTEDKLQKIYCDAGHHGSDKGWNEEQGRVLREHQYRIDNVADGVDGKMQTTNQTVGSFDALILRLNHGWIQLHEITKERILETIHNAHSQIGVQTVIISTIPLMFNNVKTLDDFEAVVRVNRMVWDIAREWRGTCDYSGDQSSGVTNESGGSGSMCVQRVLVQDFAKYINEVVYTNAHYLGLTNATFSNAEMQQKPFADLVLRRLKIKGKWPPSVAMVCANQTETFISENGKEMERCAYNRISVDGFHLCVNSLGPRYVASVSCLLGCVYNVDNEGNGVNVNNGDHGDKSDGTGAPNFGQSDEERKEMRMCEKECNDQFMSVAPLESGWVGSGTTIYSRIT